jgi:hypothetical protein
MIDYTKKVDYMNFDEPYGIARPDLKEIIFPIYSEDEETFDTEIVFSFEGDTMFVSSSEELPIKYVGRLWSYNFAKYNELFNPFKTGYLVYYCGKYEIVIEPYYNPTFWVQNSELVECGEFTAERIEKVRDIKVKNDLKELYYFINPLMKQAGMI